MISDGISFYRAAATIVSFSVFCGSVALVARQIMIFRRSDEFNRKRLKAVISATVTIGWGCGASAYVWLTESLSSESMTHRDIIGPTFVLMSLISLTLIASLRLHIREGIVE